MNHLFSFMALVVAGTLNAQVNLGIAAGVSFADIYSKQGENAVTWKAGLTTGIQAEFFKSSNLTLITELAYVQKGAQSEWEETSEENPEGTGETITVYQNDDFLSLTAAIKYRYPMQRWSPFAFLGPRLDSYLTSSRSTFPDQGDQIRSTAIFGLTGGLGLEYNFDAWSLFMRGYYHYDFTHTFEALNALPDYSKVYNRAILVDIGVAFQL